METRTDGIPRFEDLPTPVYFRHQQLDPGAWTPHSHPWGQLNYLTRGVMQLEIDGNRFLSPPQYGVWIPPNKIHYSSNDQVVVYRTVYISSSFSGRLPANPCCLTVSPILKSILEEFARRDVRAPVTEQENRLARVVVDEIESAAPLNTYLPYASSAVINSILQELRLNPGDGRTIDNFSSDLGMTVRTFQRRWHAEVGITFVEWRQRLKFLAAIDMLEKGETIQKISFKLGYSSSSAFIGMFRKMSGQTPEQYRQSR